MAIKTISCDICNEIFEVVIPDGKRIKEIGIAKCIGSINIFSWRNFDKEVNCPHCSSTVGINYTRRW